MIPTLKNIETKLSCRNAVQHVHIRIKLWRGKEQPKTQ